MVRPKNFEFLRFQVILDDISDKLKGTKEFQLLFKVIDDPGCSFPRIKAIAS